MKRRISPTPSRSRPPKLAELIGNPARIASGNLLGDLDSEDGIGEDLRRSVVHFPGEPSALVLSGSHGRLPKPQVVQRFRALLTALAGDRAASVVDRLPGQHQ